MTENLFRVAGKRLQGHWVKNRFEDGKGNYCGLGVVRSLNQFSDADREEAQELLHTLAKEMHGVGGFDSFNDKSSTTEADVMKVFKRAVAEWEKKHGSLG